jgi:transposase
MGEAMTENSAATKKDHWRDRIAEQERSGLSVRQFCKEQGLAEHCFYGWRQRLRKQEKQEPVRFALVERGSAPHGPVMEASLELMLVSGERLRIGSGVDALTLRTVLEALRA